MQPITASLPIQSPAAVGRCFAGTNGSVADGPLTAVWTEFAETSCNSFQRLYCLSNRLTLFWDGFELTGDTSRWSQTVP